MSGAIAYGEQNPTLGETAVSWQTWSDGAAGIPAVSGNADWGKLSLTLTGAEGRSAVKDFGSAVARKITLTENRYGSGAESAVLQIRGDTSSFAQDDATPEWDNYTGPVWQSWRYIQVRVTTSIVWTVATSVTTIDGGAAPYNAVQPGDIIELAPGTRDPLFIRDLCGTAARPILIRNGDGLVEIDSATGWYGFWFTNCQYFRFTGSGYGQAYGIQITRAQENGIYYQYKTDNFEFDHIKVLRLDRTTSGIAIQGKTDYIALVTEPPYTTYYDFDLDGDKDADDGNIDRTNYESYNWHIHDCYIDGGDGTNLVFMGMYLGSSFWLDGVEPIVHGVHVHDNIIQNIEHKAIQIGSCVDGCEIDHNTCINTNQSIVNQATNKVCININPGCTQVQCHHNAITDCLGEGIYSQAEGGDFYNNLLVRCGSPDVAYKNGITIYYKDGSTHTEATRVYNNTIIDALQYGIKTVLNFGGAGDILRNNLIASPGTAYTSLGAGWTSDHYLHVATLAEGGFTDEDTDNYTLAAGSDALDVGDDVSAWGIDDDLIGVARPQNSVFDIGCYERVV
jgi:hypothetical protein